MFYLFATSITWIGEFVVLGAFNSYVYKTGVFEEIWLQNLLAHLLLNSTMYPAAAIVMVAYNYYYKWIALVIILFIAPEYLFVQLDLYEHHWWTYFYSVITIITFMTTSKKWFSKMMKKPYGITRAVIFYFVAMVIIHISSAILLLYGKQYYHMNIINNIVGNAARTSIIIIFVYHLLEAFLIVLFACVLKKKFWKLMPFIISITSQVIFEKMNILVFREGWNLFYTLLIYQVSIAIFMLVEKHTIKPELNKRITEIKN